MLPLEAPIVHQLFVDESIHAYEWLRADAQVALRPYLSKLVLPRGVADLPRDRLAKDLTLVATKTSPGGTQGDRRSDSKVVTCPL